MRCPFSLARFSLSRAIDEVSIACSRLVDELPKRCDFGAPKVQGVHERREGVREEVRKVREVQEGARKAREVHVFAVRSLVSS